MNDETIKALQSLLRATTDPRARAEIQAEIDKRLAPPSQKQVATASPPPEVASAFKFERVRYENLNAKQQENFNFQKVSARLADFGFATIRLTDDWNGADFLALHHEGDTLKVQLKGRLNFQKKYIGKALWVCFPHGDDWYLYPHDALLEQVLRATTIGSTESWADKGGYSFPHLSEQLKSLLEPYRLT